MFRKVIFIVFLFVINNSFSQNVTATQKFPEIVIPGTEYIVEITINKAGVMGFMKFFQGTPVGCTATEIESKGGSFSFADGGAKIIWITLPTEDQFTVSYKVSVPKGISGNKNINGKIAYLDNNERKSYDLETQTIKIGVGASDVKAETILVTASDHAIVTSSPVSNPKEDKIVPTQIITDTVPKTEKTPEIPAPVAIKEEEKKTPPPAIVEPIKETTPVVATSVPVVEPKIEEAKIPVPIEPVVTKKAEKKTESAKMSTKAVPVTAILSSGGKTFRVQIGAFNLKPTIQGVSEPSKVILDNGMTKYFSGNFATYEEAVKRKKEMIEKGFEGAFIVSFENGKIVK